LKGFGARHSGKRPVDAGVMFTMNHKSTTFGVGKIHLGNLSWISAWSGHQECRHTLLKEFEDSFGKLWSSFGYVLGNFDVYCSILYHYNIFLV